MESVLMTTPPDFCASSSANADLPLAVGPAISTALLHPREPVCMSLVPTLICNPNNPALDSTIVDGARAVLPQAAPAHWLFDRVAADIPFAAQDNLEGDRHAIEQRLRELRGPLPIYIDVQPTGVRR